MSNLSNLSNPTNTAKQMLTEAKVDEVLGKSIRVATAMRHTGSFNMVACLDFSPLYEEPYLVSTNYDTVPFRTADKQRAIKAFNKHVAESQLTTHLNLTF